MNVSDKYETVIYDVFGDRKRVNCYTNIIIRMRRFHIYSNIKPLEYRVRGCKNPSPLILVKKIFSVNSKKLLTRHKLRTIVIDNKVIVHSRRAYMRRKSTDILTPAEWKIMKVVWDLDSATSSEIHKAVEKLHDWAINTVRTILGNLVNKGFIETTQKGNKYIYKPTTPAMKLLKPESEVFLQKTPENAKGELLCYMVKYAKLNPKEINDLRTILDRFDKRRE